MNLNLTKNNVKYGVASVNSVAQSNRSIFEAILLVVVAVLLYFFIVQPKLSELREKQTTMDGLESEKQTLISKRKQMEEQIATLRSHSSDIKRLDEAMPLDGRETKAHILFEDLAIKSGMTLQSLSVSPQGDKVIAGNPELSQNPFKAKRALVKTNIAMTASGSFEQFLGLLSRIETSGRIIDLTGVDITSSDDSSLDFTLTLIAYSYE
jgi:Tfp pilus assembly protein PilO